jgi:hypothetical protein
MNFTSLGKLKVPINTRNSRGSQTRVDDFSLEMRKNRRDFIPYLRKAERRGEGYRAFLKKD